MNKTAAFKKRLRVTHSLAASIHGSYAVAMPYTFAIAYYKLNTMDIDWDYDDNSFDYD